MVFSIADCLVWHRPTDNRGRIQVSLPLEQDEIDFSSEQIDEVCEAVRNVVLETLLKSDRFQTGLKIRQPLSYSLDGIDADGQYILHWGMSKDFTFPHATQLDVDFLVRMQVYEPRVYEPTTESSWDGQGFPVIVEMKISNLSPVPFRPNLSVHLASGESDATPISDRRLEHPRSMLLPNRTQRVQYAFAVLDPSDLALGISPDPAAIDVMFCNPR